MRRIAKLVMAGLVSAVLGAAASRFKDRHSAAGDGLVSRVMAALERVGGRVKPSMTAQYPAQV